MTHQSVPSPAQAGADPVRQIMRMHEALALFYGMAGRAAPDSSDAILDKAARISAAYDAAFPVAQRRFDALAAETAAWVKSGATALIEASKARPAKSAAARLADELDRGLRDMEALIGV